MSEVYHVTTLAASGEGSLYAGLTTWTSTVVRRVIVFDISGTITLTAAEYTVTGAKRISVLGNTSPGGIQITGYPMRFLNCESLEFTHLAWSLQSAANPTDALFWSPIRVVADVPNTAAAASVSNMRKTKNVRFTNCSFRGGNTAIFCGPAITAAVAVDGQAHEELAWVEDLQFRECMFAYPFTEHLATNDHLVILGGRRTVIVNCMFAHGNKSGPLIEGDAIIAGNIAYNYGLSATALTRGTFDVIDNEYWPGPSSANVDPVIYYGLSNVYGGTTALREGYAPLSLQYYPFHVSQPQSTVALFLRGNSRPYSTRIKDALYDLDGFRNNTVTSTAPSTPPPTPITTQATLYLPLKTVPNFRSDTVAAKRSRDVPACVGCALFRDAWDASAVSTLASQTGAWATNQASIGGIPTYATVTRPLLT